jgi:hypothetical protein
MAGNGAAMPLLPQEFVHVAPFPAELPSVESPIDERKSAGTPIASLTFN